MTPALDTDVAAVVREAACPLHDERADWTPLLDLIGDATLVLLGEASHGTHEFYDERAEITRRLIAEKGFGGVAVEADWPDAYRVNRYVLGIGSDRDATTALSGFRRFPTWMWRNAEVAGFIEWLRRHNAAIPELARRTGFYGLDLYSLSGSIEAVLRYLDLVDPEAARRARTRYACFDHFREDSQMYGYAAAAGMVESCEDEVVHQLVELRRRATDYASRDGRVAADEYFAAEQNARLILNAEEYYRSMFRGRISSWNLRDRHMAETLESLRDHLRAQGTSDRVVVWAHNSHLGDARATEMGEAGEWNVGQLTRERHGRDAVLVGFTTYTGTVAAASDWDAPMQVKAVRPALPGSFEALFHSLGHPRFLVPLRDGGVHADALEGRRLERAIGVIYRPETERLSHYFHAHLASQFDAVIHIDRTTAVAPLDPAGAGSGGEPPETYPSAL